MPEAFAELKAIGEQLEQHYRDMQDVEFTVQEGKLFMLQTRAGKRTAKAALKAAVDMVREGLIDQEDRGHAASIPRRWTSLLHPTLDPDAPKEQIASGLGASPGAATGEVVFTAEEAEKLAADNRSVILVRTETSPEDIHGMHAAKGILTARGGMTSHAAVVARGMGRPCVSGAGMLKIDVGPGRDGQRQVTIKRGEIITIDGAAGRCSRARSSMRQPELTGDFGTLMGWADEVRTSEGAHQCRHAGRCCHGAQVRRGRHRALPHRAYVLRRRPHHRGAPDDPGRHRRPSAKRRSAKLLPMQRGDFEAIFKEMEGLPVTIRLLDPPLHEFLPHKEEEIEEVARAAGSSTGQIARPRHRPA